MSTQTETEKNLKRKWEYGLSRKYECESYKPFKSKYSYSEKIESKTKNILQEHENNLKQIDQQISIIMGIHKNKPITSIQKEVEVKLTAREIKENDGLRLTERAETKVCNSNEVLTNKKTARLNDSESVEIVETTNISNKEKTGFLRTLDEKRVLEHNRIRQTEEMVEMEDSTYRLQREIDRLNNRMKVVEQKKLKYELEHTNNYHRFKIGASESNFNRRSINRKSEENEEKHNQVGKIKHLKRKEEI